MRDPGARDQLRRRYIAADERQRQAMRDALAIAGQRAAASYLDQLSRQRVAHELLRQGMPGIEVERALIERFGISRVTAWRDVRTVSPKAPQ